MSTDFIPGDSVVMVDLDRTLCDTEHREHLLHDDTDGRWERYSNACGDDTPIEGVLRLVELLYPFYEIWMVSGRNDSARDQTIAWFDEHEVPWDELRLRAKGDYTPNAEYKLGILAEIEDQDKEVVLLLDDYDKVIETFAEHGIPGVQVASSRPWEEVK